MNVKTLDINTNKSQNLAIIRHASMVLSKVITKTHLCKLISSPYINGEDIFVTGEDIIHHPISSSTLLI